VFHPGWNDDSGPVGNLMLYAVENRNPTPSLNSDELILRQSEDDLAKANRGFRRKSGGRVNEENRKRSFPGFTGKFKINEKIMITSYAT
jgi:hypothetical protein